MHKKVQIHANRWNLKKKMLLFTWFNLGFLVLFLFSLSSLFGVFFLKQEPKTPYYSELDSWDLKAGTGVILITLYTLRTLTIVLLCLYLISSICVYWLCFLVIKPWKLIVQKTTGRKHATIKRVLYCFGIYIGGIFPFIYAFILVNKGYFNDKSFDLKKDRSFKYKMFLPFISLGMIAISNLNFVGLPALIGLSVSFRSYYNEDNVKSFYKLSTNHQNILYLYFDRTDGWKMEEQLQKLLREHPQYDSVFKKFKIYKNNLSLADTTCPSVPYLLFGYNGNTIQKTRYLSAPLQPVTVTSLDSNHKIITFPGSNNIKVSQISMEKFYQLCFANFIAFWNYLGYGITNVCNLPYYGKQSPFLFNNNNSYQMNQEMQNLFHFKDFHGTFSNEEQQYQKRKIHYDRIDDAYVLGNLKNDFTYGSTSSNVFTAFYSQQNHWDFAVKDGKDGWCAYPRNTYEHHIKAIYDSLTDLGDLFLSLVKKNVWNRTTVIITSDHGHSYANSFYTHKDNSSPEKAAGFAPVFMIKPAESGSVNQKLTKDSNCLTTTADQLAIIRNLLYSNWNDQNNLDPLDPMTRYSSINENEWNLLRCYMPDPTKSESWNRKFEVASPLDWRYLYWQKGIEYARVRHFQYDKKTGHQSVFDPVNWKDMPN